MLLKKYRWLVFLLVVLFLMVAPACADSIVYTFTGTGTAFAGLPAIPLSFQLTVPNFANPPMDGGFQFFTCAQLLSSTNCGVRVYFSNQSVLGAASAQLGVEASNGAGYAFFFTTGAFGTPGTYTAYDFGGPYNNFGTLIVSRSVPEPATASLVFAGGVAVVGWAARRRKRSQ